MDLTASFKRGGKRGGGKKKPNTKSAVMGWLIGCKSAGAFSRAKRLPGSLGLCWDSTVCGMVCGALLAVGSPVCEHPVCVCTAVHCASWQGSSQGMQVVLELHGPLCGTRRGVPALPFPSPCRFLPCTLPVPCARQPKNAEPGGKTSCSDQ